MYSFGHHSIFACTRLVHGRVQYGTRTAKHLLVDLQCTRFSWSPFFVNLFLEPLPKCNLAAYETTFSTMAIRLFSSPQASI